MNDHGSTGVGVGIVLGSKDALSVGLIDGVRLSCLLGIGDGNSDYVIVWRIG